MKLTQAQKMQRGVLLATGEALHLRDLAFEKIFASGGRGGPNPLPNPPLKQSAPQTNSEGLFSLYAAAAGLLDGELQGMNETYPSPQKCNEESLWLHLRGLAFEKFFACGGRGGRPSSPPDPL